MLPILVSIGPLKIYTFGVFLVLAFFWASFLLWKNIRLTSYKEEEIFDGLFLSLFFGLFIGRLFYVLMHFSDFGLDFLKFILINGFPGLSIVGVMTGGFLTMFLYTNAKKIDFSEALDYFVSPLLLAFSLGKIGAFFSGEEVGSVTNFFLKIKYPGYDGLRHLTPLYEAIIFALAAYVSYRLLFEIRKDRFRHGFSLVFFFWTFSLTYFAFDNIKADHLYLAGVSFNGIVSGVLLLTTSLFFVYYFRSGILGFINKHGHKFFKKIHNRPKGKTPGGKGKDTKTNR